MNSRDSPPSYDSLFGGDSNRKQTGSRPLPVSVQSNAVVQARVFMDFQFDGRNLLLNFVK